MFQLVVALILLPLKIDTTAVKGGEISNRQEEIRLHHRENLHGGGDYICQLQFFKQKNKIKKTQLIELVTGWCDTLECFCLLDFELRKND